MEERYEEGILTDTIASISIEKLDKISEQTKKCICKVYGNNTGTGFFCKIKYKDELIPVMITNYHIIDDYFLEEKRQLKISINDKLQFLTINKKNKIYSSLQKEYDIIIIKIEEDEITNYLEIDENIFTKDSENLYTNESIYILHYPQAGKASVSFGYGIEKINDFDIKHLCNTENGSSGGPIINLQNNKIIGIHKAFIKRGGKKFNIGTFLTFPLNELNRTNKNVCSNESKINNKNNEIRMKIKINKEDINNKVYFLDNTNWTYDNKGNKYYHNNLKELNESNTELYIDNEKKVYKKYFIPEKEGIYSIILKFNISIKDCSFMFYGCNKMINIDLSSFDVTNITDMSYMFYDCSLLEYILHISKWNTANVNNMKCMFCNCISLKALPDISKWDTTNVTDMSHMFKYCCSLENLPDISKWNTMNVTDMRCMFDYCNSLKSLPEISKWNLTKVKNMEYMFNRCSSLDSLPFSYEKYWVFNDNGYFEINTICKK